MGPPSYSGGKKESGFVLIFLLLMLSNRLLCSSFLEVSGGYSKEIISLFNSLFFTITWQWHSELACSAINRMVNLGHGIQYNAEGITSITSLQYQHRHRVEGYLPSGVKSNSRFTLTGTRWGQSNTRPSPLKLKSPTVISWMPGAQHSVTGCSIFQSGYEKLWMRLLSVL